MRVYNKDRFGNVVDFDTMMRKFKKGVEKEGILAECKKRQFFVKKSMKRKLKSVEHQKLLRKLTKKSAKRKTAAKGK